MNGQVTLREPSHYSILTQEEIEYDGGDKGTAIFGLVFSAVITAIGCYATGMGIASAYRGQVSGGGFVLTAAAFGVACWGISGIQHNIEELVHPSD